MTALHYWSLVELAEKIRTRAISPREVMDHNLTRVAQLQPRLNAFAHIDEASACEQAQIAEAAAMRGEPLAPLLGVPLTIKSCIDVAGWPCAAGSLLRKGYQPNRNAA